jgi:hypothetical protein
MRLFNILAFDNLIQGTAAIYTDPLIARQLATADRLKYHVYADQVSGTSPTITVQGEESGNGVNWANKAGTAEINAQALNTSGTSIVRGSDTGTTGSTGMVRVRIQLGGTTPVARIRLWVTGRGRMSS